MKSYERVNEMLKRLAKEGKIPEMTYDEHGLRPAGQKTRDQQEEEEILNMLGLATKRR